MIDALDDGARWRGGPMKLEQTVINAACELVRKRYASMLEREAKLAFSYELQGFVAAMADAHGEPLPTVLKKITELIVLIAKANGLTEDDL